MGERVMSQKAAGARLASHGGGAAAEARRGAARSTSRGAKVGGIAEEGGRSTGRGDLLEGEDGKVLRCDVLWGGAWGGEAGETIIVRKL
jgi:hypothetical protein